MNIYHHTVSLIKKSVTFALVLMAVFALTSEGGRVFAINVTPEQLDGALFPLYDDSECVGPSCACSGTSMLAGTNNAEKTWNFFIGKGLSPEQAAGVMGNLSVESSFDPFNQENSQSWPSGGWGLPQWTGGRRDAIRDAVIAELGSKFYIPTEQAGAMIGTPEEDRLLAFQLDFLYNESLGRQSVTYPGIPEWDGLLKETTIESAMIYWEKNFERAGVPALGERLVAANELFALYGSGITGGQNGGGGSGCGVAPGNCPTEPVSKEEMIDAAGISVHPCISEEVERVVALANSQGLNMAGWGWRDNANQIALREAHGCGGSLVYNSSCKGKPLTAVPGTSNHERGAAVDFTCDGTSIPARNHPCFVFLRDNSTLFNLLSEPWHWSVDGG